MYVYFSLYKIFGEKRGRNVILRRYGHILFGSTVICVEACQDHREKRGLRF
jgi:hypothetical protein